ncbi:pentapeptide repeat-containing protein [Allonocardiopsis opalescens]|nr:pentapeptide repeat-containing protein [Allonocardiopsis opalescens]
MRWLGARWERLRGRAGGRDWSRLGLLAAILGMAALALVLVAALVGIQLWLLGHVPPWRGYPLGPAPGPARPGDMAGALTRAFAVVTGLGGVALLVIAYHRQQLNDRAQRLAERTEERAAAEAQQAHERELAKRDDERFTTAVTQLGADQAAVRLGGVHTLTRLADEVPQQRRVCIDVLCAYLRMPYEPEPDKPAARPRTRVRRRPGDNPPGPTAQEADAAYQDKLLAYRAMREVRHTIIRTIRDHLREDATASWHGHHFDLTGVVFDGGDLSRIHVPTGTTLDLTGASFTGGATSFAAATFTGGTVHLSLAGFTGGRVDFRGAAFTGGTVDFTGAEFAGGVAHFSGAAFTGGTAHFAVAFTGGTVHFNGARFAGGTVHFPAVFVGGTVNFNRAEFASGIMDFSGAEFASGTADFSGAAFTGGMVDFSGAEFAGRTADFSKAKFAGGRVNFGLATGRLPLGLHVGALGLLLPDHWRAELSSGGPTTKYRGDGEI